MECKISNPVTASDHDAALPQGAFATQRTPSSGVDDEANSKKRKREVPDQSDPKLREFLHVMKTGREGVINDESNLNTGADLSANVVALVPEDESDDEYEKIPAKREKLRKLDSSETPQALVAHPPPPKGTPSHTDAPNAAVIISTDEADPEKADEGQPATEATDDDWLRSRTNRLLDLVDPDDLPTSATSAVDTGSVTRQNTQINGVAPHSSGELVQDAAEDAPEPEVLPTEGAAEAISRTSRLFIRNLPYSATEEDLAECFGKFGSLQEVCRLYYCLPPPPPLRAQST